MKTMAGVNVLKNLAYVCVIAAILPLSAEADSTNAVYKDKAVSIEKRIADLIGRMTLEEKITLLTADNAAGTSLDTAYIERLGIPRYSMTDGPHGASFSKHVNKGATAFPVGINMGATWNTELIKKVGGAIADETRAQGRNVILGPCLDIQRTPTRGRNFESFTEDPYLMGKLGVAYIQGVQEKKIVACAKHFAGNTQEWHRMYISAEVDKRALYEIHMRPFQMAVQEADVWFVMGAYNKLNGDYACANPWLLTEVLKKEWGFKGVVVSDWGAVHSTLEPAMAGLDIEMGGTTFMGQPLLEMIKNGKVDEAVVNDKVSRILYVMMVSGIFDQPWQPRKNTQELNAFPEPEGLFEKSMYGLVVQEHKMRLDCPEHRSLSLETARESIVLLKNDRSTLPLDKNKIKKIAVFGPNAYVSEYSGGGSAEVIPTYVVSALEGILKKTGQTIHVEYFKGVGFDRRYNVPVVPSQFLKPLGDEQGRTGLRGEYFNNRHLEGEPVVTRIDEQIFFHFCGGEPAPGVNPHDFSVRWTGTVSPPETGVYTFTSHHHGAFYANEFGDGVRMFINGKMVIDAWEPVISEVPYADVYMEAGKEYDLRFEYHDAPGEKKQPIVILGWQPENDDIEKAAAIAKNADAAIIVAGYNRYYEGENNDRGSMFLPGKQELLINAIAKANPQTVVVLYNGGAVIVKNWIDSVGAAMTAWYPGQEGGHAIADVLFGDVNPSGKLPCTFGLNRHDYPDWGNYPGDGETVTFEEGIYVGYRHFDKHNLPVQYPFGYGLSYTTFSYRNLKINPIRAKGGQSVTVSVEITNDGRVTGSEVVQLYLRHTRPTADRPVRELKRFAKILLTPGQTGTIKFMLDAQTLEIYDLASGNWNIEQGEYEVQIGASSRDIKQTGTFRWLKK